LSYRLLGLLEFYLFIFYFFIELILLIIIGAIHKGMNYFPFFVFCSHIKWEKFDIHAIAKGFSGEWNPIANMTRIIDANIVVGLQSNLNKGFNQNQIIYISNRIVEIDRIIEGKFRNPNISGC